MSNADHSRRYRARRAGTVPPFEWPVCAACGGNRTGKHDPLCSRCWAALTPEGRADRADRVERARARKSGNDYGL